MKLPALLALLLSLSPTLLLGEADAAPPRVAPAPVPDGGPDVMETAFCAKCHPAIAAEHAQSTHGRAFTDEEARLATSRFDIDGCIDCHTPRPIFETGVGQNPMKRHHGLEEGNTCMTCHFDPARDYSGFQGGAECRDAFHPDAGTVEACASCHRNHGTPYQWELSPTGRASGRTCTDCHMETELRPVAVGGPVREVRKHVFPGARSESQVRRAYRYGVELQGNEAVVTVTNKGAGHKFPTELKQRAVESLVVVRDGDGNEVARSRMVFRDPYKRPYGLVLPVNTQIPGGESREHRVPLTVAEGTVETTLFYKLYYPIEDHHPDLARTLERRVVPFSGVTPSDAVVDPEPEVQVVTPEGIAVEAASPGNLVDFAHPPIGTVAIEVPEGSSPEDVTRLIELFQFPVGEANRRAQARLAELGEVALPALIEALGSWDNKTWAQASLVLERMGETARPAVVAALTSDDLYTRIHARELAALIGWGGDDVRAALAEGLEADGALDRASAAEATGALGMRGLAPALRELVADSDPDVVRAAALALGALRDKSAVDALARALDAAHYVETRRDLALALAHLGSTAGVPALLEGLEHPDDILRESFFEAFFEATGVHRGFDPLAPRPERLAALAALQSWWAGTDATYRLPDPPLRDRLLERQARRMVHELGGTGYGAASLEENRALEETLVNMGEAAVPSLIRGLKYPAGFGAKRALVCRALGRIGDPRAVPALGATLRDPVVATAAWAAWALERVPDPAMVPALRRHEERLLALDRAGALPADVGPVDRLLVSSARARLAAGDRGARELLETLLHSRDGDARRQAKEALGS